MDKDKDAYKFTFKVFDLGMSDAISLMRTIVEEADLAHVRGGFTVSTYDDVDFSVIVESIDDNTAQNVIWKGIGKSAGCVGCEYEGGYSIVPVFKGLQAVVVQQGTEVDSNNGVE